MTNHLPEKFLLKIIQMQLNKNLTSDYEVKVPLLSWLSILPAVPDHSRSLEDPKYSQITTKNLSVIMKNRLKDSKIKRCLDSRLYNNYQGSPGSLGKLQKIRAKY